MDAAPLRHLYESYVDETLTRHANENLRYSRTVGSAEANAMGDAIATALRSPTTIEVLNDLWPVVEAFVDAEVLAGGPRHEGLVGLTPRFGAYCERHLRRQPGLAPTVCSHLTQLVVDGFAVGVAANATTVQPATLVNDPQRTASLWSNRQDLVNMMWLSAMQTPGSLLTVLVTLMAGASVEDFAQMARRDGFASGFMAGKRATALAHMALNNYVLAGFGLFYSALDEMSGGLG